MVSRSGGTQESRRRRCTNRTTRSSSIPRRFAWGQRDGSFQLVGLNGAVKGTVGGGSVPLDTHDLELLPERELPGDRGGARVIARRCPASASISHPGDSRRSRRSLTTTSWSSRQANQVVWRWSVADHINVAVENANWHTTFPDVIHMNSVVYDGHGGVIFSARHLDAVYRVDMATGAITWKLGGNANSREPECCR